MTYQLPLRSLKPAAMMVDEAVEADRRWFAEHRMPMKCIGEFCPGAFGSAELPEVPSGFRYAMLVRVIHQPDASADGRHQSLAVCDDPAAA